jgi:hypothetical protein
VAAAYSTASLPLPLLYVAAVQEEGDHRLFPLPVGCACAALRPLTRSSRRVSPRARSSSLCRRTVHGSRGSAARGPSVWAMPAREICVRARRSRGTPTSYVQCRRAESGRQGAGAAASTTGVFRGLLLPARSAILMPPPHVHTYARLLECWINRFRDARGHRVRAIAIGCSPGWLVGHVLCLTEEPARFPPISLRLTLPQKNNEIMC